MPRRPHYIKDNFRTDYPQQCIWFDCETYFTDAAGNIVQDCDAIWARMDTEHKLVEGYTIYQWLKIGYACYRRLDNDGHTRNQEWLEFTSRDQFWAWVLSKTREQTKLYLFCHNTSFDLPVLDVFTELYNRGYVLRSAIIDAPPTILRYRSGKRTILILDTLNFFRMPLKVLGSEIGLQKLQMPEDNDLGVDWETYGKRDVQIMMDACLAWWQYLERNDMGSFAPTLAGQAMRTFRHKYMSHRIFCDDNKASLDLTRDGYYGGRTEAFRIGKFRDHFTLLDVNSMYPFVMAYKEYPYKLLSHSRHVSLADLSVWLQKYAVTARVLLRTTENFAPIWRDNKLMFPVGEFECILSTPELKYALEHAEILRVYEAAAYEKAFLFSRMMLEMYQWRLNFKRAGDKVNAFLTRKLLNSFYGKWGQSGGKWDTEKNIPDLSPRRWIDKDFDTGKVRYYRQMGGLRQVKDEEKEGRDSFPAIAAHVTAYARMELYKRLICAGRDNVYYCDTDSILTTPIGVRNLREFIHEEQLGSMSVKGEYEEIEIFGAKDYRFGSKVKTKGIRGDALWLDANTVSQQKWSGLRGLVSSGIVDRPLTQTIRKRLSRCYDKGVVLPDGRVMPHWLGAELSLSGEDTPSSQDIFPGLE